MTDASRPDWVSRSSASVEMHEAGQATVLRVARGADLLLVSFCAMEHRDHVEQDWCASIDRYAAARDASHIAIYAASRDGFADPALLEIMAEWRGAGVFDAVGTVLVVGADHAGAPWAALRYGAMINGATVLAVSPDDPGPTATEGGTLAAISAALLAMEGEAHIDILSDPLDRAASAALDQLPQDRFRRRNGVGLRQSVGLALRRLDALPRLLDLAVEGALGRIAVARLLRPRRTLYLYRQSMEAHLDDRGRADLKADFTRAFKRQARARKAERATQAQVAAAAATPAGKGRLAEERLKALRDAAVASPQGDWPRSRGNVWMLDRDDAGHLRYMSDQYRGRVMGFEERDGTTLAQTPPLALGMIALGGHVAPDRPLPERFDWHVVDPALDGQGADMAARSHGVAALRLAEARGQGLQTVAALSQPQASMVPGDADPDGALVMDVLGRLRSATAALERWDKPLFVDRLILSLLGGAPTLPERAASEHYARTARMLQQRVCAATGQASAPVAVVSQSLTPHPADGPGEAVLAEGRLDIDHPAARFVVATPRYPFLRAAPEADLSAAEGHMLVDEMEARAVAAVLDGHRWYCPRLRQAWQQGRTIVAEFSTLAPLEFDGPPLGFGFANSDDPPGITDISVRRDRVFLEIDDDRALAEAGVWLTYAWGQSSGADDQHPCHGTLRDAWSAESLLRPGRMLHRYALSTRTPIVPSDLRAKTSRPAS